MTDEIDEVTNRSGKPHAFIEVESRQEPFPSVVLLIRFASDKLDTIRMLFIPAEARTLADTIYGVADAIDYTERHGLGPEMPPPVGDQN